MFFAFKVPDKSPFNQPIRVCCVKVNDNNEFVFVIKASKDTLDTSDLEFIYREAAGIYWNDEASEFHSTPIKHDWDVVDWAKHFVGMLTSFGLTLEFSQNLKWEKISTEEQARILAIFERLKSI